MADAAEDVAGLPEGTIRLKWPNDLVVVVRGPGARLPADAGPDEARGIRGAPLEVRKLAGVLGETAGLGSADPTAVIGIGVNADWAADAFPADLRDTMTSLREVSGGRPIDRAVLLDEFLGRLETRTGALRGGRFDVAGWVGRQVTTGLHVQIDEGAGPGPAVRAVGVDASSGALVVADPASPRGERAVLAGDVTRLRLAVEV
jgi:biotin-(acetyl-CoA carboxylase) ligase